MEDFPILINKQVAIVIAEGSTGHILDVNFSIVMNNTQLVYIVCDSMKEALNKISFLSESKDGIEFVIYGKNKEVLKYISPR